MPLGREIGPGDIVLDGDRTPPTKKGAQPPINQTDRQTDRETDRPRSSVGNNRPHLLTQYCDAA